MGKPVVGDVVVIPFPFSDFTGSKRRPALVVASLLGDDLILCMITSQAIRDPDGIDIETVDFAIGGLPASKIRPSRLFTAESSLVVRVVGSLTKPAMDRVLERIRGIFT